MGAVRPVAAAAGRGHVAGWKGSPIITKNRWRDNSRSTPAAADPPPARIATVGSRAGEPKEQGFSDVS